MLVVVLLLVLPLVAAGVCVGVGGQVGVVGCTDAAVGFGGTGWYMG